MVWGNLDAYRCNGVHIRNIQSKFYNNNKRHSRDEENRSIRFATQN